MVIKYNSSRKEIWNFYWYLWFHGNLKWVHARIFILISLIVYFYHAKALLWSLSVFLTAILFGIVSIIWMPLFPQIKFKAQSRTLDISETGITTSIGKVGGAVVWNDIASITESAGYIYINCTNGSGLVVPLRAFSGVEEQIKFFSLCQQYRAAHKNSLLISPLN